MGQQPMDSLGGFGMVRDTLLRAKSGLYKTSNMSSMRSVVFVSVG